jgi:hypothetical protein
MITLQAAQNGILFQPEINYQGIICFFWHNQKLLHEMIGKNKQ